MTRVYVDVVADLFHYGHAAFLAQARALGDELVVGIHSDETVASYKRLPIMTMHERAAVVRACRDVDEVVLDAPLEISEEWLRMLRVDLVVHGDDFDEASLERCYGVPRRLGLLVLVPYTPGISTGEILDRLRASDHHG